MALGDDGAFAGMKPGADLRRPHHRLGRESRASSPRRRKSRGFGFLDAPVSGGQAGAENGQLTVMCGGEQPPFAQGRAGRSPPTRKPVSLMGAAGAGQLTKMVNQICIAGLVQGLAEGLHFAKRAGLDIEKVIDVISKGAAQSWQMENRYKTMVAGKFDFGFAVDWMRKDLGICLAEARRNGARCRWRRWSTSSTPTCRRWAAGAGTRRA